MYGFSLLFTSIQYLWFVNCDWVEIPHITKNSHSYPEEHFESIFIKPKTTFATIATTTGIPKRIYPKDTFSDVLERPPYNRFNESITNKSNKFVKEPQKSTKPLRESNNQWVSNKKQELDSHKSLSASIKPLRESNKQQMDTSKSFKTPTKSFRESSRKSQISSNKPVKDTVVQKTNNRRNFVKPPQETNNKIKGFDEVDDKGRENQYHEYDTYDNDEYYDEYIEDDDIYYNATTNDVKNKTSSSENSTMFDNFLPILKNIQDTLIKTVQSTTSSKVTFLQTLRDNLLYNIKERIVNLWSSRGRRGAREHKEDYHVDSNEGPLMTIGFLTFAAFLIKLVLQLINAFKNNQGIIVIPTTTTTAATLILGRRRRSEEINEKSVEINNLIEEYEMNNYNS